MNKVYREQKARGPACHDQRNVIAPLLSCVMPTRNRPHFVRQALKYLARQTFASRELVVVDDSDDPVERLCVNPSVRYVRCAPDQLSLGAKMNLGIEHAAGEFIIKWDDDDWYRPDLAATMGVRPKFRRVSGTPLAR